MPRPTHVSDNIHRAQLRQIVGALRTILTKSTGIPLGVEVECLEADDEDRVIFSYRGKAYSLDVADFLADNPINVCARALVAIGADSDATTPGRAN